MTANDSVEWQCRPRLRVPRVGPAHPVRDHRPALRPEPGGQSGPRACLLCGQGGPGRAPRLVLPDGHRHGPLDPALHRRLQVGARLRAVAAEVAEQLLTQSGAGNRRFGRLSGLRAHPKVP
jgi:hypothetical protein